MEKFSDLLEAIGGTIDPEAGIVRGVRILGRNSKNGRRYSDKALESAAKLYVDRRVNVNHLREGSGERAFQDLFGEIKNPVVKGDFVEGDLHFLTTHPLAKSFVEAAKKFPKSFGLSHHAAGDTVRQGKDVIVEDVTAVHSVDLVSDPATNSGLFEATAPAYDANPNDVSGDDDAMAEAAIGTLMQTALKQAKSREDFLDKAGALWDVHRGGKEADRDESSEAKESTEMKPEEIKALIAEQIKQHADKVSLLEAANASQAMELRCLKAGVAPSKELLESFAGKDDAFIDGRLAEMAKDISESAKPKIYPASQGPTTFNFATAKGAMRQLAGK